MVPGVVPVAVRSSAVMVLVKCPHLLYQSQCESSVDFWFERG